MKFFDSESRAPSDEWLASMGLGRSLFGYYEFLEKPSEEELERHYRDTYYQGEGGSYSASYDEEELAFIKGQIELRHRMIEARGWLGQGALSMLDVGCGEGFALAYYLERGWKVRGLDFSTHGCESMNPHCLPFLEQGNVFANLERLIRDGETYDLIMLDNVLEHVVDPLQLLERLHRAASPGSVLVVDVPNDFSALQMEGIARGWIDRAFWVGSPEHLSYFNAPSLRALSEAAGWNCGAIIADFPVDWFLSNPNSNYIRPHATGTGKGTELGRGAHRARVALENLMRGNDMDELLKMYEAMAAVGMGRSLVGFFLKP